MNKKNKHGKQNKQNKHGNRKLPPANLKPQIWADG